MKLIPLTKGQFAKVDDEDFHYLRKFKWQAKWHPELGYYYAVRSERIEGRNKTFRMSVELMKPEHGMKVDHINHDTLDNQKRNLRICTHSQNNQNRSKGKNTTSIYKGVFFNTDKQRWTSKIKHNRISTHLGHFKNEKDAAIKYNEAATKLFGEFAYLNKIL